MSDLNSYYEKIRGIVDRKLFIYGFGKLGKELCPLLEEYNLLAGIIDNDPVKQGTVYHNHRISAFQEFMKDDQNAFIVITASKHNTDYIIKELLDAGYQKNIDFVAYDVFLSKYFPLISYYSFDKLFVAISQICLTERCTLRCKNCAHGCNKVPVNQEDMSIDMVKKSADYFFTNVDIVKEFVLIGGEPFLYKKLDEAIEYIGSRYRDKMLMFSITTNGTVFPNDELIKLIKKHNVTVRVSDYSPELPSLERAYEKLKDKLAGVQTIVLDTSKDKWFDYGFGKVDNGSDVVVLKKIFENCATPCREIRGEKYYYCVMARSVSENMSMNIGLDEYLDLSTIKDKSDFLEFEMGNVNNGYLSMCRYCRGADAQNHLIPAAVQEKSQTN